MSPKRANFMKQADQHFSKYIRHRDQTCQANTTENCTETTQLQCAHIISRSYKPIRTNPANAVALCASCHVYYTHRPLEWEDWCSRRFGALYMARLKTQATSGERVDWKFEAEYWKGKNKEMIDV